ncbi:MAG: flagellar export chaperone FlgN [Velocimicrobium sp.]
MEINQTYVTILIDTLRRKVVSLNDVIGMTNFQSKLIEEGKVDTSEFEGTLINKQEMIDKINQVDDGFEKIYDHVREALSAHAPLYQQEILVLKELISQVTEKSVAIKAAETRNRDLMERYFSSRKKTIKDCNIGKKTIQQYQETMKSQYREQSLYMDKRK